MDFLEITALIWEGERGLGYWRCAWGGVGKKVETIELSGGERNRYRDYCMVLGGISSE